MLRRQLPVRSPLPVGAVAAGLRSLAVGAGSIRSELRSTLVDACGCRAVRLTDSGTSALRLVLRWLAERDEVPVALPAYSCYDVATAAVGAGVPVCFYDLDPVTLSPSPASIRETVEAGARSLVVAHLYGIPVDLGPVLEEARRAGITVVEDAAQAAGGSYGGDPLGSFGSVSILSFAKGKGITGCGGGAVLAHDERWSSLLPAASGASGGRHPRGWSQIPRVLGLWALGRPGVYGLPARLPFLHLGETRYRSPRPPGEMPDVAAAILSATLPLAAEELEVRRRNARRLDAAMGGVSGVTAVESPAEGAPGYLKRPVLVSGASRPRWSSEAARRRGILSGYPRILPRLSPLRPHLTEAARGREYPGASRLTRSLFTLPTHGLLGERDLVELEAFLRAPASEAGGSGRGGTADARRGGRRPGLTGR